MTFWTAETIALAKNGDDTDHVLVADWLEERDCVQAGKCFRLESHRAWRAFLVLVAESFPHVVPDASLMSFMNAHVKARSPSFTLGEMQRIFGFDPNGLLPIIIRGLPTAPSDDVELET